MARILNTCEVATAQNRLRNAMREALEYGDPVAMDVAAAVSVLGVVLTEEEREASGGLGNVSPDAFAAAFERAGYSRELGAAAYRAVARLSMMDAERFTVRAAYGVLDDVRSTPEWQRLAALYAEPVVPCCEWEVPASN